MRRTETATLIILLVGAGAGGCSPRSARPPSAEPASPTDLDGAPDSDGDGDVRGAKADPAPIPAERRVLAYRDGQSREMDQVDAEASGLTIVDFRDSWVPAVLRGTAELPSSYEVVYADLANERGEPVDEADPETATYYLEVYGISPSFSTIRARLEREEATPCFGELDYETLAEFEGFLAYQGKSNPNLKEQARAFRAIEARVEKLMREQGVERAEDLEVGAADTMQVAQYVKQLPARTVIRAAQKRLACEKLMPGRGDYLPDAFDWPTHIALLNFERRHRLYGWGYLNQETAKALSWNPRESAYHTFRRALAERIIDAAGIIEDGSDFQGGKAPSYTGRDGKQHQVRDLVEEFRAAAMDHLGLNGPDEVAAFLRGHDFSTFRVALPLPELPEYYSDTMDLDVVINRGDVWYDFPFDEAGNEIAQPVGQRPTLNLYVEYNGQRIPLVRYGTTIGGWRSEVINGVEHWAYKGSDVGDRVWRNIVGAPTWIPPDTTPLRDLVVKRRRSPRWWPDYAEMGPGYASAYGLVMGVHEQARERSDGTVAYLDNGIRSHGSVNYQSIQKRHSHGCHRLHNHRALRLFSFVLKHRPHTRVGQTQISAGRTFAYEGQQVSYHLDTRGYYFELTPPVPLTVTRGRIMGTRQTPIEEPVIKPEEAERLRREAEAQADAGIAPPAFAPAPSF